MAEDLLVIKTGTKLDSLASVAGDYEDWIARGMGVPRRPQVRIVYRGEGLPPVEACSAVVVPGSAAMVTDPDAWIAETAAWLRNAVTAGIPVLGICFGHQLLAQALGGRVGDNPNGVEVGTTVAELTAAAAGDTLLGGLPRHIDVQVSHRQAVLEPPPGAVRLAATGMDGNHAFRFGERAWGIQFHPEFDAAITRRYIDFYAPEVTDADALRSGCRETPEAATVLRRFASIPAGE